MLPPGIRLTLSAFSIIRCASSKLSDQILRQEQPTFFRQLRTNFQAARRRRHHLRHHYGQQQTIR